MIPKIIHYCWFGRAPKPELTQKCIESWKRFCPDYEIIEWNEDNYDCTKIPFMHEAYEAKKWGFVPDFARLDIIYQHGGIYLDTDVELVRPMDDLLGYGGFVGFEDPQFVALGLGFGAEAGSPLIRQLMTVYETMHFRMEDGSLRQIPSPQHDTPVFREHGAVMDGSFQVIDRFALLPIDYLCPYNFSTKKLRKTENTHSIHWYSASWYDDAMRKENDRWQRKLARRRFAIRLLGEERYMKLRALIKGK